MCWKFARAFLTYQSGLKLNLEKFEFFKTKISYLGFTIDKNGLSKNDDRTLSVSQASIPKDIHELRAFIGMANYYSRLINDFAQKMQPLYCLLQKDVQCKRNGNCQNAYEVIIREVTSVLRF